MAEVTNDIQIIITESESHKALSLETKSLIANLTIYMRPWKLLFAIRALHCYQL